MKVSRTELLQIIREEVENELDNIIDPIREEDEDWYGDCGCPEREPAVNPVPTP